LRCFDRQQGFQLALSGDEGVQEDLGLGYPVLAGAFPDAGYQ